MSEHSKLPTKTTARPIDDPEFDEMFGRLSFAFCAWRALEQVVRIRPLFDRVFAKDDSGALVSDAPEERAEESTSEDELRTALARLAALRELSAELAELSRYLSYARTDDSEEHRFWIRALNVGPAQLGPVRDRCWTVAAVEYASFVAYACAASMSDRHLVAATIELLRAPPIIDAIERVQHEFDLSLAKYSESASLRAHVEKTVADAIRARGVEQSNIADGTTSTTRKKKPTAHPWDEAAVRGMPLRGWKEIFASISEASGRKVSNTKATRESLLLVNERTDGPIRRVANRYQVDPGKLIAWLSDTEAQAESERQQRAATKELLSERKGIKQRDLGMHSEKRPNAKGKARPAGRQHP